MNILEKIYQDKLIEVRNDKKRLSGQEICQQIKCLEVKPKDFALALKQKFAEKKPAIIAEIKKASPSKGVIREDFDPVKIAKIYEANGAAAISVLTDEKYFMGKKEYLSAVRKAVSLPLLRKDFIIDPYQIWEAKLIGADCILLIMAMLDLKLAKELEDEALKIGLNVLVEVHNQKELNQALQLKTPLIGINNRNLKNLEVDINLSKKLAKLIPSDRIIICESGIKTKEDILEMQKCGINNFLIGESLMSKTNIGKALKELF
jgi:indole-3-glycerol phosphate synthase